MVLLLLWFTKRKKQNSVRLAAALLCGAFLFCHTATAYALNGDYLTPDKWVNNPNATYKSLCETSLDNELEGLFAYYIDNRTMTIYTYFSVEESSLREGNRLVEINFAFTSPSEEYSFSVNEDGMATETLEEEQRLFAARTNFAYSDNGIYMAAAEYNGKESALDLDIALFVNNHKYRITKSSSLSLVKEAKTTVKSAGKESSKKAAKTTTTNVAKSKQITTRATTKFAPKGKYTTAAKTTAKHTPQGKQPTAARSTIQKQKVVTTKRRLLKQKQKTATAAAEGAAPSPIQEAESAVQTAVTHMTKGAKAMLLVGIAIAGGGLIVLLSVPFIRKKANEAPTAESTEPSEDEKD